jgi:hypothetical protein
MLGPTKHFTLHYRGQGCGGCNLPFDTVADAVRYAERRHGTEARVEDNRTGEVAVYRRKDCRGRLREVTP